jgi:hypothetical protein
MLDDGVVVDIKMDANVFILDAATTTAPIAIAIAKESEDNNIMWIYVGSSEGLSLPSSSVHKNYRTSPWKKERYTYR